MQLTDKLKSNFSWFFASLLLFVTVVPFSQALVSITSGILLFSSFLDEPIRVKTERIKSKNLLLLVASVFIIYLLSYLILKKPESSAYDLQKSLFFLIIPLAFMIGKPLTNAQIRILLMVFIVAVFGSTIVAWFNWFFNRGTADFAVHKITLISHIRFSFQLILVFWILVFTLKMNFYNLSLNQKLTIFFSCFYFLFFLFFQQSLTGLIAFGASTFLFTVYSLFTLKGRFKWIFSSIVIILVLFPIFYLGGIIIRFYQFEMVDRQNIERTTLNGNNYTHDFNNPTVENGRFVYLYICDDELRTEWNKISKINYDSIISTGYPLNASLIRYMTSKGLRKDAKGIKSLSQRDIENIEKGYTNIIFQKKKYSPYPRIYQTVWEYYMYSKTGDPSYQSFSQRLEFARAAVTIIKENPWFGVGAGNWKEEFRKTFEKSNSKLDKELYASSHNQYLNYMVKFGIPGFLLIMFLLVYPVIRTKSYTDPLFLTFLVLMFAANFGDSNFETHMGSSFFLFFYCLFVTNKNKNYLISGK
jgi:hypothetical protein